MEMTGAGHLSALLIGRPHLIGRPKRLPHTRMAMAEPTRILRPIGSVVVAQ
jgi:hypothetical protein